MIRPEVEALLQLGRFPSEDAAEVEELQRLDEAMQRIERPVTKLEARCLLQLFGDDGCFGMAWALLTLVDSCGRCVLDKEPSADGNPWVRFYWERWRREYGDG